MEIYTSLDSKKEFKNINEEFKYHLVIIDEEDKINYFIKYLHFVNECTKNKHIICSLDFEFNTKKIALFQITFEIEGFDRYIFFIYPPINPKILKILQGSDSLDLPYLFGDFLKDKKLIKIFLMNFVDTKFLCEYSNICDNVQKKCQIYEQLLDRNIITREKYDALEKNDEKMGPIYEIFIDIKKLSHELKVYSMYDVVFLKKLVDSFGDIDMVSQMTQFTMNHKFNFLSEQDEIVQTITKMNNCYLILDMNIVRLNELYNYFTGYLNNEMINNLSKVNYFKKTVVMIVKYVFYFNVSTRFRIYQNKNIIFTDKIKMMIIRKERYYWITLIVDDINIKSREFIDLLKSKEESKYNV
jgi:hypothetical protein